jgi:PA14 domain
MFSKNHYLHRFASKLGRLGLIALFSFTFSMPPLGSFNKEAVSTPQYKSDPNGSLPLVSTREDLKDSLRDNQTSLPNEYIGIWSGSAVQYNPNMSWTISLALIGGSNGTIIGTVGFPSVRCGAELTLLEVNSGSVKLLEDITYGPCWDMGIITLSPVDNYTLDYIWNSPDGSSYAVGSVTRKNSNKVDLPSEYLGVWKGYAVQVNPDVQWPILMTLSSGELGSVVGIAGFAPYRCGAELSLLNINPDSVELLEDVTYGPCWDLGTITLTPNADGTLKYEWQSPDNVSHALGSVTKVSTCGPNGWIAEYFNNRDLQSPPIFTQCDQKIDFYWGKQRPAANLPIDNFSVRWTRTLEFSNSGWYRFRTFTDDGVRLYIDSNKVIDIWSAQEFAESSVLKQINQGYHQIKMEYSDWDGDAMAYLKWSLCPNGAMDCDLS